MQFSKKDILQIENKGLGLNQIESQIDVFKKGVAYANLVEAASIDNGIKKLDTEDEDRFIEVFKEKIGDIDSIKFVPASGAATRMFKFLFQFLSDFDSEKESINAYINKHDARDLSLFRVGLEKFPFYQRVIENLSNRNIIFDTLSPNEKIIHFIETLLDETHLNYGNYPKGLIPFHEYNNDISTAFEEHLFETALYTSKHKPAKLHFTISERFRDRFKAEFERIEKRAEQKTGATFDISFSYQQEITDTIAVNTDNTPFRDKDGLLLFRPSGHGALLNNLNTIDKDIIFIKNIDNVVVKKYKDEVAKYKMVLAGILFKLQEKVFKYLEELDSEKNIVNISSLKSFLQEQLNLKISPEFDKYTTQYQIEYLKEKLNRPIRVCGMVKNEREPGGGPFWVKDKNGNISLQIVESAQINKKIKSQKDILDTSTHFNPVDLVCGIRNYKGEKFNLQKFVDKEAVFISKKTKNGKYIKALELPGLWNGSMAHWNSIFVEVPIITFNPVKTVNDLLKPGHQIKSE